MTKEFQLIKLLEMLPNQNYEDNNAAKKQHARIRQIIAFHSNEQSTIELYVNNRA